MRSTDELMDNGGSSAFRGRDTRSFNPLLYRLSYRTKWLGLSVLGSKLPIKLNPKAEHLLDALGKRTIFNTPSIYIPLTVSGQRFDRQRLSLMNAGTGLEPATSGLYKEASPVSLPNCSTPRYMVAEGGIAPPTFGLWGRRATTATTPRYMVHLTGLEPARRSTRA